MPAVPAGGENRFIIAFPAGIVKRVKGTALTVLAKRTTTAHKGLSKLRYLWYFLKKRCTVREKG